MSANIGDKLNMVHLHAAHAQYNDHSAEGVCTTVRGTCLLSGRKTAGSQNCRNGAVTYSGRMTAGFMHLISLYIYIPENQHLNIICPTTAYNETTGIQCDGEFKNNAITTMFVYKHKNQNNNNNTHNRRAYWEN